MGYHGISWDIMGLWFPFLGCTTLAAVLGLAQDDVEEKFKGQEPGIESSTGVDGEKQNKDQVIIKVTFWYKEDYTHYILTIYSLYTHYILTIYSLYTHYILTIYSLYTHYILTIYSLYTHYILTIYSLCTHYILTIYSLYTHYTR